MTNGKNSANITSDTRNAVSNITKECIRGAHMDIVDIYEESVEVQDIKIPEKKKHMMLHGNVFFASDLIDTPVYDEAMMRQYLDGIVSNILMEMDKQGITVCGLAELSDTSHCHLSRIFNHKSNIGLPVLIKVAAALRVSPSQLLPDDMNKRKTNGERFDQMTKDLDVSTCNFVLGMVADLVKEIRRIKNTR